MPEKLIWGDPEVTDMLQQYDARLHAAGYAEPYLETVKQQAADNALNFPTNYNDQAAAETAIAAETYWFVDAFRSKRPPLTDDVLMLSKVSPDTGKMVTYSVSFVADKAPEAEIWTPRAAYRNVDLSVILDALVTFEEVGLKYT